MSTLEAGEDGHGLGYVSDYDMEKQKIIIDEVNALIEETNSAEAMANLLSSTPILSIPGLKSKDPENRYKISYVDLTFEVLQLDRQLRYDSFISAEDFNGIYKRIHEFEQLVPRGMYLRVKKDKPSTLRNFLNHMLNYSDAEIIPCYTLPTDRKPSYYRIIFE